jgi:hypothetical protein
MVETTLPGQKSEKSVIEQLDELQSSTGEPDVEAEIPLEKPPAPPPISDAEMTLEITPDPRTVQIQEIQAEAEFEKAKDEQIKHIQKEAYFSQFEDVRSGVASVFANIFEAPADITATALNFLLDPTMPFSQGSNGEILGRALQDGLNKVYETFGGQPLTAEETGLDKGLPTSGFTKLAGLPIFPGSADQPFSLRPLIPEAEPEFGNLGTQERSRYYKGARIATENAVLVALTPMLRALKHVPDIGPVRMREKIRRFLIQMGNITTSQPQVPANIHGEHFLGLVAADTQAIKVAAIETWAGIMLAVGMDYAERKDPGSELSKLVFGTTFAAGFSSLPLRTLYGYIQHWKAVGVSKWGGASASRRAQTVLKQEATDATELLKQLELAGTKELPEGVQGPLEKVFVPGFYERLGPALRTGDEGTINLFTAFLREAEKLESVESALHQQLYDLILQVMKEDVSHIQITQASLKKTNEAVQAFITTRLRLAEERLAGRIARSESAITQDEAHLMGVELIVAENRIADNTADQAWKKIDLSLKVTSAPATTQWEKILRSTGAEEGNAILKILDGENDLFHFLGTLKHTAATRDPITGVKGEAFTEFVPGSWGKEITMKQAQNLRSRILRTNREEQVKLVPNNRKIDLLSEVAESLRHSLGSLDRRLLGPIRENALLYEHALAMTRIAKDRFGPGTEVGNIVRTRRGGQRTPENIALKNIFLGAGPDKGAKGDAVIKRILASMQGDRTGALRGKALEMQNAMEQLFRQRFTHFAMKGGVFNKQAARTFLDNHKQQLHNFRGIREELEDIIELGEITKLHTKGLISAMRQVDDPSIHMSTLYAERGPASTFGEMVKEQPPNVLRKKVRKLVKDVNRDPTGQARRGLTGSFFLWLISRSTHKQPGNRLNPEMISGASLQQLWQSAPVQVIAKEIMNGEDFIMMSKILASSARLDMAILARATRGGSFNLEPNALIEKALRIGALKLSPLPASGGASIAQAQILSQSVKDAFRKNFRDPAHSMLYDAFMNKNDDLLKALFTDIISPEDVTFVIKQINAFMGTYLFSAGERSLNEDSE